LHNRQFVVNRRYLFRIEASIFVRDHIEKGAVIIMLS